jgi:glycosyltransferase involved in cell wall biosynthesis
MPKVSVIVPVYNVEKFIHETITSVLNQTFTDFELLVVDDESPDQSIAICQQFTDLRIKIIRQKNRGLAGARNTGIRHAQGEFIALLDSDDLWHPEKLARHLAHFASHPEVGISFSRSAFIDEMSQPLGTYQMPKLTGIDAPHLLCRNPIGNGSAPVIRQATLEGIKFTANLYGEMEEFYFDDQFRQSEDIECWLRIAIQTPWQIEGIPEPLTLYRVNSASLSANMEKQLASWEKVIAKTRTYAPDLVNKWESLARGYQYRYLSRRAIRNQDSKAAVNLINHALHSNWRILIYEPQRSFLTLVAAYMMWLLPRQWYQQIEQIALKVTGKTQERLIHQSGSKQGN